MGYRLPKELEAEILARAAQRPGVAPEPPPTFADEGKFQAAVIAKAKECGWTVYHTYDSRRSEDGWLDLAICRPPRLLFWELKSEKGKLTPAQKKWLNLLRKCDGVEADAFWPKDWERIVKLLA